MTDVLQAIRDKAQAVGQAVGLIENPNIPRYRELRQIIDRRSAAIERVRRASERLKEAYAARKAGAAVFDNMRIDFAIGRLLHEHMAANTAVGAIDRAEREAIGLCPDAALQRERRKLRERQKQLADLLHTANRSVELQQRGVTELRKAIDTLSDRTLAEERRQMEHRLEVANSQLVDAVEERDALVAQRNELLTAKETLRQRMLSVEV